ncbi:hypothetical protein CHLRE_02g113751v5 [Chlamydomonas reinhardtii]|uniref:Glycosyltransferase 2-like domain-containing protein n=1 Tax=Chlamydomonas reinhardtii TaxID=3055 RepID=A0A2K3E344_CHLRE|nr:uncharacterized protein CHLRE_02g113751v5 [Chlamydomonas reinhardtii]PNW87219.1 hypothetical protein CHLRE_02g113751v5 [Chlamydomonas reinhardtii]
MNLVSALLVLIVAQLRTAQVYAGPDHTPIALCSDLYHAIKPEHRHLARDSVQALQALESYIGQAKLGRPLPANSNATAPPTAPALEGWLAGNYSRLQQLLDGSGASQRLGGSSAAVTAAKTCLSARLHPDGFAGRPVVSILLNYFKRPGVIPRIAEAMRQSCDSVQIACEISVNVDNPHEAELWASQVRAFVPGFVMPAFSANLHEARGYNRAAKLARGRYLIIWQDDQFPPAHGKWLLDMIRVFDAYPQLGILGMNTYRLCKNREMTNRWGSTVWRVDPRTGVSWTFAQHVDFAPLAVRASIYHEVGGLDENTARPGDCGIWGDWELTSRAWMDGWQVGFMYVDGRGGDGEPGGTHLGSSAEKCWGRQQWVAMNLFARRFDHVNDPLCDRVWLLNMLHHTLPAGLPCPYNISAADGSYDTRFGNCSALLPMAREQARQELAALEAAAVVRVGGAYSAAAPLPPLQRRSRARVQRRTALRRRVLGLGLGVEAGAEVGEEVGTEELRGGAVGIESEWGSGEGEVQGIGEASANGPDRVGVEW